ncbi:cobalt ABC transporter substrate-binding protein CbiN, partial [Listeria monocytogenes]|nr:cobalt ABC transporter substrate-binding protein CbiN [Listeria monocytogenes]
MKKININVILILLVVLLMVSPFFFNKTGEYGG